MKNSAWGFEPWCTTFANGMPALIGRELTWPLVGIGLIGIALLGRRLATLCYGTLAIYLLFAWFYRCGNWFQVILPAYPIVIIGAARLFATLHAHLINGKHGTSRAAVIWPRMLYGLLLVVVCLRAWLVWPTTDSRNRPADDAFDRAALWWPSRLQKAPIFLLRLTTHWPFSISARFGSYVPIYKWLAVQKRLRD
ncbi:MAG: hypothetical protein R2932_12210 [Caldilineaceae bacterium]